MDLTPSTRPDDGEKDREKGKLETVTVQLWTDDLAQLARLGEIGRNRESLALLRRIALHIGTAVLSLSTRMILDRSERIGLFTADDIARDLLPDLDPAIQTLIRLGYPVQVLPVEILSLLQFFTQQGSALFTEPRSLNIPLNKQGDTESVAPDETTSEEISDRRAVPSQAAMRRMGINEEESI
jgi:hypothetical protein